MRNTKAVLGFECASTILGIKCVVALYSLSVATKASMEGGMIARYIIS